MFRILDSFGRTIREADGTEVVTLVNPARRVKVVAVDNLDSVIAEQAQTAETSSDEAQAAQVAAESARDQAAVSAGAAALSASAASTSSQSTLAAAQAAADIASQAAIDAQNAINSIAGSHDDFHEKYLGDFATDPMAGIGGAPLAPGDLYYNTADLLMRIYTEASGWVDQVAGTVPMVKITYIYGVDASQSHVFSGVDTTGKTLTFTEGNLEVYVNGVYLIESEYTADASANSVTIDSSRTLSVDDDVLITVFRPFSLADVVSKSQGGTYAGAVTFTLGTTFNEDITVNGDADINGHVAATSSATPLLLDRNHSTTLVNQEHSVVTVSGNGQLRGDLGIHQDQLYIQSRGNASDSKTTGLQFADDAILPRKGGASSDGIVDLGTATKRFNVIHAHELIVDGRSSDDHGLTPLAPTDNDLTYVDVGGKQNLRMPAIVGGANMLVTKTASSVTLDASDYRLLALGFCRQKRDSDTLNEALMPNVWHAAIINEWRYQSPEYLTRVTTPVSEGFTIPTDRRCVIEYGATMGFAFAHEDADPYSDLGPRPTNGPMRLRLGCTSGLATNEYQVSITEGYSQLGEFQQLYGAYETPATSTQSEFRVEGQWPFNVEGSWSEAGITFTDADGFAFGPPVAWVRIWDTEIRNNP